MNRANPRSTVMLMWPVPATLTIILAALMGMSAAALGEAERVRILYVPFEVHTMVPTTSKNIDSQAFCSCEIKSSNDTTRELARVINTHRVGIFDDQNVRLKVIGLFEHDVLIDMNGGMPHVPGLDSGASVRMREDALQTLKYLMCELRSSPACECAVALFPGVP